MRKILALAMPGVNWASFNLVAIPKIGASATKALHAVLPTSSFAVNQDQAVTVDDSYLFGDWPLIRGIPEDRPRVSFYNVVVVGSNAPAIEAVGATIRRARPTVHYMKQFMKGVTPEALDSQGSQSVAAGATVTFSLGLTNPADDIRPAHWLNLTFEVPSLNSDTSEIVGTLTVAGTIQTINGNEKGVFSYGPAPVRLRKGTSYRLALFAVADADDGERQPYVFRGDSADPVVVTFTNPVGSNTAQFRATGSSTNDTQILDRAWTVLDAQ
jgi:hypothetical protein